jgi:xylitol oxidase
LFTLSPAELRSRYERMREFIALTTKYDPKGKFRNDFLNTYVFAS